MLQIKKNVQIDLYGNTKLAVMPIFVRLWKTGKGEFTTGTHFCSSVTTGTHLSPLVLVQNSEDLLQFPLILILLHLCSYQLDEFIKINVASTYRFVHKQGWDRLVVQGRWWINQYGWEKNTVWQRQNEKEINSRDAIEKDWMKKFFLPWIWKDKLTKIKFSKHWSFQCFCKNNCRVSEFTIRQHLSISRTVRQN